MFPSHSRLSFRTIESAFVSAVVLIRWWSFAAVALLAFVAYSRLTAQPAAHAKPAAVSAAPPAVHLANISTRLAVGTGNNVLIAGFIVTGTQPKKIIVRGIGPTLPVNANLADPTLELHDASGAVVAANENWRDTQQDELKATTIPPGNDYES